MSALTDLIVSASEKILDYVDKSKTGWINVKSYGIDNKGTEDCSEKLQALLDSLTLGSVVYFPQGKYLFKSGITVNKSISIIGDGGINMINSALAAVNGTIFLFDSDVSDATLLTIGTEAYNVDIQNIGFCSTSAKFSMKNNCYTERPSEPYNPYEFTINQENVNAIDATKGTRSHFYHCNFDGFSGYGIKTNKNRLDDCRFYNCGNAIELQGNDCILQNCRISSCNNGIYTGSYARSLFIYDIWIDLIVEYAIYGNQVGGIITGIIDHIGYSAFAFTRIQSIMLNMRINRCGMYYANATASELGSSSDKVAWLTELKKYALICADNITDSTIIVSAYYRTLDDESASTYYSPNCIIATDLSVRNTVTIPNIEKNNEKGINVIAINASSEMNIIYPDGSVYLRRLGNFCSTPTMLTRTSAPKTATPANKVSDFAYDRKNKKLYIATAIDGTSTTWEMLTAHGDGTTITETDGILSISADLLARIEALESANTTS